MGGSNASVAVPPQISVASPKPKPQKEIHPKFKIQPKKEIQSNSRSISIHSKDPTSPYAGLSPQQIWKLKRQQKQANVVPNGQKGTMQSPITIKQSVTNKQQQPQQQIIEEHKQQQIIKDNEKKQKIEEQNRKNEKIQIQKQKLIEQQQQQQVI